jgi:ATP-dependent protease Clp ATPase subunit
MEEAMLKIMYTIPSDLSIKKVVITADCITGGDPKIIRDPAKPRQRLDIQN